MKKIIGGEAELKINDLNEYFTDSGRSSLRLILDKLKDKYFLIPNYLCEIILKIFDEYEVKYSFYNINQDFSVDKESITIQQYDVLYIINYFGMNHEISNIVEPNKIVIGGLLSIMCSPSRRMSQALYFSISILFVEIELFLFL